MIQRWPESGDHTYQEVTLVDMHVLVHELKDCEPESRERRQRQQWAEVLKEHLENTTASVSSGID